MSARGIALLAVALPLVAGAQRAAADDDRQERRRLLLLSIDGFHRDDLARWISGHPQSALARLAQTGLTYSAAKSTTPSDSFPGLLALVTGGTPRSTGVYYDDSYDRTLFPPGSNCQGHPGSEISTPRRSTPTSPTAA